MGSLRSVLRFRPVEWNAAERRLRRTANVDDLRRVARRRLPRGVFDYIDGGAGAELTMRRNVEAFHRVDFNPRVLQDVGHVDASTTLLGKVIPMPMALGPTGFTRMVTPGGELDVARAAATAGLPYTLSTLATRSIEEVAAVSDGPKWFQVYVWRDRGLVKDMIDRAAAAGYEAIMLTVDTAVLGRRERDARRGFTLPPQLGVRTLLDGAVHPAWTWAFARSEPITFANVVRPDSSGPGQAVSLAAYINEQFDPTLSWADLAWFRAAWSGPIIVKGIQCVEDARIAADEGVDAISLSNHGGRQLDSSPPILELVAPVADAIGDRAEIICDGGVRRGSDIAKAVALGARACTIGRAYLYALGAAGERGVERILSTFKADFVRTMVLSGRTSVADLTADTVRWRDGGAGVR